jgi:hypothetical protein
LITLTEIVPLSSPFRQTLWSTQPPIQRVPPFFSWGKGAGAWNWLLTYIYWRGWDFVEMDIFLVKVLLVFMLIWTCFMLIWTCFITRDLQRLRFIGVVSWYNLLVKKKAVEQSTFLRLECRYIYKPRFTEHNGMKYETV